MSSKEKKTVHIKLLYMLMAAVGALLLVVVFFMSARTEQEFTKLQAALEDYISTQRDTTDMEQASDYLTRQARSFAMTGNRKYLDNFFTETQQTKRRDKAIENMSQALKDLGGQPVAYLEEALSLSNELVKTEYRSMRLVIDAKGYDISSFPKELQSVQLSAADKALSAEEKMALASEILSDDAYIGTKDDIYEIVSVSSEALIDMMRTREQENAKAVSALLSGEYIVLGLLFIVMILTAVLVERLVVSPLEKIVERMRASQPAEIEGAEEMRFLASNYNEMLAENIASQDRLEYEATHDSLTGLYNRAAYEDIISRHERRSIAFLLVDVDYFKQFNDTYGHEIGDKVLQRVANTLSQNFRAEDSICRIGGDEFAVIMVYADSSLKELVRSKIENIARMLKDQSGDVPGVTLSIGVAFSDRKDPQGSIYADADKALYKAKEKGRNTYAFYE